MIQNGLRKLSRLNRGLGKATRATVSGLGVEEPVDKFESGLKDIPGFQKMKRLAAAAVEEFFPKELPLYKEEDGPFPVNIHHQDFFDAHRQREVPLTVYYPEEREEKSPVVVFSHGLAGNSLTYRYLGKHLASHGYTVLAPKHTGSDTKAVLKKTPLFTFTQEELQERVGDLRFVLDQVDAGVLPEDILDNIDTDRMALAGHSFGALTTQAVAGVVTRDDEGQELPLVDDRFDAFIAISPYGDALPTDILGMDTESYSKITKPVLFMNGEEDDLFTFGKGPTAHSVPFQKAGSEEKYQVIVDGADHASFAQVIGLYDSEVVDMTNSTSVAFLDAHLKDDQPARSYLTDDLGKVARSRESLAYIA